MAARGWAFGFLLGLVIAAQPAAAQRPLRPLQVPASESWKHSLSGLILPSAIDGSKRVSIGDAGSEELDVSAQYEGANGLITTVYLFRSQVPSVPLWFDRGRAVLEQLRMSQSEPNTPATGAAFALPRQNVASAMRVTFPFTAGGFRSTGLALAATNGWLIKVRMSSKTLQPLQLDSKLLAFVSAITWPAETRPAVAAEAVQPCPDKLAYAEAKMVKPDVGQALLSSFSAMAGSAKGPDPSTLYCRERSEGLLYGVYRQVGSKDGYLMAIADSGRVLSIGPSMQIDPKMKPNYSVTLLDLGQSAVYPAFDHLPAPDQALNLIRTQRPVSSSRVGSTTINIEPPVKP